MNLIAIAPKDYDRLKYLEFNRDIDENQVDKLRDSLRQFGFLMPIAVREHRGSWEIFDGQHRAIAGVREGMVIPAVVIPDLQKKQLPAAIAKLNTTQSRWTLMDYQKLYAKMELEQYLYLEEFMDEYTVNLLPSIYLWRPDPLKALVENKGANKDFKAGRWAKNPEREKEHNTLMKLYLEVGYAITRDGYNRSATFNEAILMFILHPKFDREKFMTNFERHGLDLDQCHSCEEYLAALAVTYNKTKAGALTFDYQIAIDGSVVTCQDEADAIRKEYVDMEEFADFSPYSLATIRISGKTLQPNSGIPDVKWGRRKYWRRKPAIEFAMRQRERKQSYNNPAYR